VLTSERVPITPQNACTFSSTVARTLHLKRYTGNTTQRTRNKLSAQTVFTVVMPKVNILITMAVNNRHTYVRVCDIYRVIHKSVKHIRKLADATVE